MARIDHKVFRRSGSSSDSVIVPIDEIIEDVVPVSGRIVTRKKNGKRYLHLISADIDPKNNKPYYIAIGLSDACEEDFGETEESKSTDLKKQIDYLADNYKVFTGTTDVEGNELTDKDGNIVRWYSFGVESELDETPVVSLDWVKKQDAEKPKATGGRRTVAGAKS